MNSKFTVLFAGTFDPFTIGHKAIVEQALKFADTVYIGVGINAGKHTMFTIKQRIEYIKQTFAHTDQVVVESYDGLTVDYAKARNISCLLRGVRSLKDFEYERQMADINRRLTGIETILLFPEPQFENISSTMVRELIGLGTDVSQFLPVSLDAINE